MNSNLGTSIICDYLMQFNGKNNCFILDGFFFSFLNNAKFNHLLISKITNKIILQQPSLIVIPTHQPPEHWILTVYYVRKYNKFIKF
jgi:hypothetical protein